MAVKFNPAELAALKTKLDTIKESVGKKAVMGAVRKGAVIVADAVKEGAAAIDDEATPSDIEKNVAVRFSPKRFKATGEIMYRVGIRGGAKKDPGDEKNPGKGTAHWRFVEFGAKDVPARPFMGPALESNAQEVFDAIVTELKARVNKL